MPEHHLLHGTLGPYILNQYLTEGGTAEIYLANRGDDSRVTYVAKALKEEYLADSFIKEGFEREGEVLKSLDKQGLPKVLRTGTVKGRPTVIMEYIDGYNIHRLATEGRRFNRMGALVAMVKLVAYLHNNHLIHNDLKPENFMIRRSDGRIYLIDFGNVMPPPQTGLTAIFRRRKKETRIRGTPSYMAPEVLRGDKPSFASDCYALGACAHFLITNRPPLSRDQATDRFRREHESLPDIFLEIENLPHELLSIFNACLRSDPIARPVSAQEVFEVLREHFSQRHVKRPEEISRQLPARS